MNRQPAVADRFYPGSEASLARMINSFKPEPSIEKIEALSLISPHAGYIFSGKLACQTIASAVIPESVIIIGPNHHGMGNRVAVSTSDWDMPHGTVPIDRTIATAIINASPLISEDESAHRHEHSLEVQIPFLQCYQNNLRIIPIAVTHLGYQECQRVADALVTVLENAKPRPLMLASTDMSHYESRKTASMKDKQALDKIVELDPEGLFQTVVNNNISMCGIIPVTITLIAAKKLGATTARLIGYTDSGDTSGDLKQVVGYAGFIIA